MGLWSKPKCTARTWTERRCTCLSEYQDCRAQPQVLHVRRLCAQQPAAYYMCDAHAEWHINGCRDHRETSSAVAVTVGSHHTAFLMSNGALYTCGSAANGRLGTKTVDMTADLDNEDDNYSCPQVVEAFFPRSALSLNQYVTFVSCGHSHSLAITLVGILKAWGGNDHGQLGLGDTCAFLSCCACTWQIQFAVELWR